MTKCIDCGKILSKNKYKRCAVCFGKKHSERMKGRGTHFYKDGRTLKQYYCIDCKKKINVHTYLYGSKRCMSCSIKYLFKIGKLNTSGALNAMYGSHKCGKSAPGYIHGMAYFPYPVEWKFIRLIILKRDNYKCGYCNKKGKHVHHIDYNKQNCKNNNLILLCQKCHSKTLGNRDYWYAYYIFLFESGIKEE